MAPVFAQTQEQMALIFVGVACTIVVSLPVFFRANYRISEPISFVLLLVIFGVLFKLSYIVSIDQSSNEYVAKRLLLWGTPDDLLWGAVVVLVGLVCLILAYEMRQPRVGIDFIFQPGVRTWHGIRLQIIVVCLFLFSIGMLGLFIVAAGVNLGSLEGLSKKRFTDDVQASADRMHTIKYYFYRGAAFSKFVFYLSLVWLISRKKPIMSWMGAIMIASLLQTMFLFFVMGSRANIVLILMDGLFLVYCIQQKLEIGKIAIAGGLVALLLLPMLASRDQSDSRFGHLVEKTLAGRDMMDISKTCHIINAVPENLEYRYGETLVGWLAAPIPRSMWPDKPMWAERGTYLAQSVFGDKKGITGVPPGLIAEFYWNLGLVGVTLGMVLLGLVLKLLYVTFLRHDTNPTAILIYTIIVTRFTMFTLGNDLGTGILKAGLDLAPLFIVLWYIGLKDKTSYPFEPQSELQVVSAAPALAETATAPSNWNPSS